MFHGEASGVLAGAILLGLVHGAEPGHGWPIAAAYAMDRSNRWGAGLLASTVIGVGHLVSSIAVVAVFFLAKSAVGLGPVEDPVVVAGVAIGSPVGIVAGVVLVLLGVREYRGGHAHDHGGSGHSHDHGGDAHSHDHGGDAHSHEGHSHDDHGDNEDPADYGLSVDHATAHAHEGDHDHARDGGHGHDHTHDHGESGHAHDRHDGEDRDGGLLARLRGALPGGGHSHGDLSADQGLRGLASAAFLLGFAHEEEFEIIALCAGSSFCLELMLVYALAVVLALVALTMLLVAGFTHYEERAERFADHLPTVSAVVLVAMGLGFVLGLF